jgi:hypothetical protein
MPLWKHQKMIMRTSGFVKFEQILEEICGFFWQQQELTQPEVT